MREIKVNKNITEGLVNTSDVKILKQTAKTIKWNPSEYNISKIDLEQGEIIFNLMESESDD